MKRWANPEHVLNPEHGYEPLIEASDYRDEEDLVTEGQVENRERWEVLANTAAYYAHAADTAASARRAAIA